MKNPAALRLSSYIRRPLHTDMGGGTQNDNDHAVQKVIQLHMLRLRAQGLLHGPCFLSTGISSQRHAAIGLFCRPPVMAFKWRHWGQMTGNLVCPIGPDTRLEAEATGQEVELWGLCVAHLDYDFRITKLEVSKLGEVYSLHKMSSHPVITTN